MLSPPDAEGQTVGGRPLLNVTLALNYAAGGTGVWGYHAFNLTIHFLAAMTLYGVVRRTLLRPVAFRPGGPTVRDRFGPAAPALALAIALLWALHPLATEAVTYVIQRVEALMALFYLLTLYCFIRGAEDEKAASRESTLWFGLSWLACLLGMATKEVMATAPLLVLLYDRVFLAGSFAAAWRRRRRLYAALAATWGLLAYLATGTQGRGGTGGGWSRRLFPGSTSSPKPSRWPTTCASRSGPVR